MAVINGAPGAAGPVLNHYSKSAVTNYLNRISEHITGKIGIWGILSGPCFATAWNWKAPTGTMIYLWNLNEGEVIRCFRIFPLF